MPTKTFGPSRKVGMPVLPSPTDDHEVEGPVQRGRGGIDRGRGSRGIRGALLRRADQGLWGAWAAWSPAPVRDGSPSPMGLGWFVQIHRGERVVWHFGSVPNAYSALVLKLPARKITLILLANSDRLSSPFQLQTGDVGRSLFASLFLKLVT